MLRQMPFVQSYRGSLEIPNLSETQVPSCGEASSVNVAMWRKKHARGRRCAKRVHKGVTTSGINTCTGNGYNALEGGSCQGRGESEHALCQASNSGAKSLSLPVHRKGKFSSDTPKEKSHFSSCFQALLCVLTRYSASCSEICATNEVRPAMEV